MEGFRADVRFESPRRRPTRLSKESGIDLHLSRPEGPDRLRRLLSRFRQLIEAKPLYSKRPVVTQ